MLSACLLCMHPLMARNREAISSPDRQLTVVFQLKDGIPYYDLTWRGRRILQPSRIGFELADGRLDRHFKLTAVRRHDHDETWSQPWGEEDSVRNHYRGLTVSLTQQGAQRRRMDIEFRVFNDGIGFRYVIPRQKGVGKIAVNDELTEFAFAHDAEGWSFPANRTNYFEGLYARSPLSRKDTVATPLTIEYEPGIYLAVHEAALTDYAKLNLTPRGTRLLAALTPWSDGTKVYTDGTLTSPWRTLIVGSRPGDLITNRVMLNLNEPCRIEDTSWIEPGKYLGIWWSIHKKKHTWEMGPRHGATTENVKRYIDFAAAHGFQGVLSEGWNPGWGQGEKVTYLKAYPDFDIEAVTRYAREKGVRWIGHLESWGQARLIESEMDSAFAWFSRMGVNAVKTGYVGSLLDGRELSNSQYGIRHYRKVVETAARHHIMIDNHEPAMPTGLQRTYPNLMTQEGARGQEYNAWDITGGNPPEHTVTLPFTRALAGPIDFTPAIFDFSEVVEGTHPHSTIAKQLGEFVVLYSPLQMAADEIDHYKGQPAFTFIESCPTNWSRTVVANGEIGQYITVCRKERGGNRWFVGSITNGEARQIELPLNFLDSGRSYKAIVYEDGPGADYETNPYAMSIRQLRVDASTVIRLSLARSGGAAIRIEEAP